MATIILVHVYVDQGSIKLQLGEIGRHSGIIMGFGAYYELHSMTRTLLDMCLFNTLDEFNAVFINEHKNYKFMFQDKEITYKQNSNGNLEHERFETITYTLPNNPLFCLYLFQALVDYLGGKHIEKIIFLPVDSLLSKLVERPSEVAAQENEPRDKKTHEYYRDRARKYNTQVKLLPLTKKDCLALSTKAEDNKPPIFTVAKELIAKAEQQGQSKLSIALQNASSGANHGTDIGNNLTIEHMFAWLYDLNVNDVFDPKVPKEDKDQILIQLQEALNQEKDSKQFPLVLTILGLQARHNLYAQCIGSIDIDKHKYSWTFTEWSLLSGAKFELRADGKMDLHLKNSIGYENNYAPGQDNHLRLHAELDHLFALLKLEVVESPDYHELITFSKKSSEKLVNMGLYIDRDYQPTTKPKIQDAVSIANLPELSFLVKQGSTDSHLPPSNNLFM